MYAESELRLQKRNFDPHFKNQKQKEDQKCKDAFQKNSNAQLLHESKAVNRNCRLLATWESVAKHLTDGA